MGLGSSGTLCRQDGAGAGQRRGINRHRHLSVLQPQEIRVQRLSHRRAERAQRKRPAQRPGRGSSARRRRAGARLDDSHGGGSEGGRRRRGRRRRRGVRPGGGAEPGEAAACRPDGVAPPARRPGVLRRQEPADVRQFQTAARKLWNQSGGPGRSGEPCVSLQQAAHRGADQADSRTNSTLNSNSSTRSQTFLVCRLTLFVKAFI